MTSVARTAAAQRRSRLGAIILAVLVVGLIAAYLVGSRQVNAAKRWCRNVPEGASFLAVDLPKNPIEVKNGTWTYDGGVSVTFADGVLVDKYCG